MPNTATKKAGYRIKGTTARRPTRRPRELIVPLLPPLLVVVLLVRAAVVVERPASVVIGELASGGKGWLPPGVTEGKASVAVVSSPPPDPPKGFD
jgi:hypothetical protein